MFHTFSLSVIGGAGLRTVSSGDLCRPDSSSEDRNAQDAGPDSHLNRKSMSNASEGFEIRKKF